MIESQLEQFSKLVEQFGGEAQFFNFEPPATEADVVAKEKELGYEFPTDFRKALLTITANCEYRWFLQDKPNLPDELRDIFCGELSFGLNTIAQINEEKNGWIENV